ncbi:MAG TPA: hypothetical protein VF191_15565 [Cyclobacteriaceae bacterium]
MTNGNLIAIVPLIFFGFTSYSQQGLETFTFKGITISVFDEKTEDYKETDNSPASGKIVISYIDNTVEIASSGGKRNFRLTKVDVDPETLRTMLELDEGGKRYVLAIASRYATLIGVKNRIVYNRAP